jgi:hypothetical protein
MALVNPFSFPILLCREEKEAKEKQELDEKNALAKAQKEELTSRLQGLQKEGASKEVCFYAIIPALVKWAR